MKRSIAVLLIAWCSIVAAADMHTYGILGDSPAPAGAGNAGVYWDLPGHHWCGLEVKGSPGFFCDVT